MIWFKPDCRKCGSRSIMTSYVALQDVLRRTCTRCGFWWSERPKDRAS